MSAANAILVAVDFSPCSAAAFRQACRMAAWKNVPLTALHVVEIPVPLVIDPYVPTLMLLPNQKDLIAEAKRRWGALLERCPSGVHIRFDVEVGSPRDVILETARRQKAGLLVLGAHSSHDARRGIGPIAAACAQWAPAHVMVVREQQAEPFRSVVACIDFSETSRQALEAAVSAATEDAAALHILHVYSDPWSGLPPPPEIEENMPEFIKRYTEAVQKKLQDFCRPLEHELRTLKPEYHAVQARRHADGIKAFIERHGCDLAVLGTRGRWNVRDFVWGTTAERVVREAPCSVLAVKPASFIEHALARASSETHATAGHAVH